MNKFEKKAFSEFRIKEKVSDHILFLTICLDEHNLNCQKPLRWSDCQCVIIDGCTGSFRNRSGFYWVKVIPDDNGVQ